jgi:hypothetical protein
MRVLMASATALVVRSGHDANGGDGHAAGGFSRSGRRATALRTAASSSR